MTCFALSNLTAESAERTYTLFMHEKGYLPMLVRHLQISEADVKNEALYCLSNGLETLADSHDERHKKLAKMMLEKTGFNLLPLICNMLDSLKTEVLIVALDALAAAMKVDGEYTDVIEECKGYEKIETLANEHQNDEVNIRAQNFINDHWNDDLRPPTVDFFSLSGQKKEKS